MIAIINLLICDDDIKFAYDIKDEIEKFFKGKDIKLNIKVFNEVKELENYYFIEHKAINAIFLDVELGVTDGIKVAKKF